MAQIEYNGDNPFDEDDNPFQEPPSIPPQPRPVISSQNSLPRGASQKGIDPELLAKAERLRAKEEELDRRERELNGREKSLKNGIPGNPPNWPKCKPLIRHNIDEDMPTPQTVRLCKMAYYGWMALCVILLYNAVCMLAALVVEGTITDFVLALVFLLILPLVWFMVYRILYRAARKSKPSLYIVFWIFYSLEFLSAAFFVIGVPGTGAAGLFWMFKLFEDQKLPVGFMLLASSVLWGLKAAYCFWVFIASRLEYNKAGGLAAAKKEAGKAAWDTVKSNPDLVLEGVKYGAAEAASHPDLVLKGMRQV